MPDQLVDPHRDLVAERRRHRVLTVRAARQRHVGAAVRKVGHGGQRLTDQFQEYAVRLAQHQQIAGLGNILRRGTPMHPAAMLFTHHAAEFPDQRHDGVAGAGEAFIDAGAIQQFQASGVGDRLGSLVRNDAKTRLGARQSDLDVEPRLPAILQAIQCSDAGIGNTGGGRQNVTHGRRLLSL